MNEADSWVLYGAPRDRCRPSYNGYRWDRYLHKIGTFQYIPGAEKQWGLDLEIGEDTIDWIREHHKQKARIIGLRANFILETREYAREPCFQIAFCEEPEDANQWISNCKFSKENFVIPTPESSVDSLMDSLVVPVF